MKYKSALLFFLTLPLITGCGPSKEPSFSDQGDGYSDTLPTNFKDGAILHCFNWTYKQIEDNMETIANAGFKNVQVSPVQQPKSGGAFWWAYYQPVSFSIADNSLLGTKDDLTSLCATAEKYNVGVIADIVVNHLANVSETAKEEDGTPSVSLEVEKYEPEIYALRNDKTNPTFHHNKDAKGAGALTQVYPYGNLPDLNTANPLVQERVYSLLKECIDVGIDGFRFDAAKHIETPTDKEYASDFWPNTLGKAEQYYKTKTNKELFAYGEVLGEPGGGRKVEDYTNLMRVTDASYISSYLTSFISAKPQNLVEGHYGKNTDPDNLITWIESHDDYCETKDGQKITRIRKMWSTIASRKGSRGLFFARPDAALTVGRIADYSFEDETIASANRFHNRFINANEQDFAEDTFYVNQRFEKDQTGAIIVSLGRDKDFKTEQLTKLKDGIYFDQITGNQVKVYHGKAEFTIGETGVAILTPSKNVPHPSIILNEREGGFVGSKTVKASVINANEATYQINNNAPIAFSENVDIKIGDEVNEDGTVNIKIVAKNGDFETSRHATFKKIDLIPGGFNIVNFDMTHFDNYELYLWTWVDGAWSKWNKDYEVKNETILVNVDGIDGFLMALFPKGYEISIPTKWDDGIIKQSSDISGNILKQGFYDASGF